MNRNLVLITGASSGIGKSFAYKFASRGYDLLLVGRRESLLREICNDILTKYSVNAEYMILELSNDSDINRLISKMEQMNNLEILINNAGFGLGNDFINSPLDKNIEMIKVHDILPVKLIYSAIPLLKDKVNPAIINVSSIASFLISPGNEMYCASKAFLTSFSESLSLSLKKHNIKVQVLCPGFTLTDFHAKLGYDANDPIFKKFMSSDKVVDISLKYLKKDKVICIPGVLYKFVRIVINFIPRRIFYKFVLFYSQRNSLIKTKTE
jgi:short-subunit dehydrogenase